MTFFWVGHFEFFFTSFQWKTQPFHMKCHFFLHYGWFFQNLGKEAVRTFMHTTVMSVMFKKCADFTLNPIKKSFLYNCKMIFFLLSKFCAFLQKLQIWVVAIMSSTSDFPLMQHCLKWPWIPARVIVQGVKSLGGHFACLCWGLNFMK